MNSYNPDLFISYLQNDILIGEYPKLDFYIKLKNSDFNILFNINNLYGLYYDNIYFMPNYPFNKTSLEFSLKWNLFD